MALSQVYGADKVARAIEDAFEFQAFSSDYIANLLALFVTANESDGKSPGHRPDRDRGLIEVPRQQT
jgi:hypothetical protein